MTTTLKTKTITYWVAPCLNDSAAYNIRGKTKKAVLAEIEERNVGEYGPVVKHSIHYTDTLDLLDQCLGEGRGCEPY